jgi:hypothetical protein
VVNNNIQVLLIYYKGNKKMKRQPEDIRTAKSLYAEYKMLLKRANNPAIPKIEQEYTMNMVNRVKSRINFDLLNPQKKQQNEYEEYEYRG